MDQWTFGMQGWKNNGATAELIQSYIDSRRDATLLLDLPPETQNKITEASDAKLNSYIRQYESH